MVRRVVTMLTLLVSAAVPVMGQSKPAAPAQAKASGGVDVPADYVIGVEDVLSIVFWRDEKMSGDVVVRPDGKISLLLVNEVQAAGLTTEQLRQNLEKAAAKFITDPTVGVGVKAINSRKVFITGMVGKPGPYSMVAPMTVMELITMAGGVAEYADKKNIRIARIENGKTQSFKFNYNDFVNGKHLDQNIVLKPGDIVTVR